MITLSKFAKMANVSVSTASKAFSMSPDISDETREKIFALAKQQCVFKKFYNAKYPKLLIGVVCSVYNSTFHPNILTAIQEELDKYGYDMCVASSNHSVEKEKSVYEYYSMYTDVDAILTIGRNVPIPQDFPLPRVDISPNGNYLVDDNCPTVVLNYESIEDAIHKFYNKGVKNIGFITCYENSGKAWKYRRFMAEIYGGAREDYLKYVEVVEESGALCGYLAAKKLISENRVPRALFCERDDIAFGAIRAFGENGIKVPSDVAIVGWNNTEEGEYSTPSLSTIFIDTKAIVSESVDMLVKMLNGQKCQMYTEIMSTYIERESSHI